MEAIAKMCPWLAALEGGRELEELDHHRRAPLGREGREPQLQLPQARPRLRLHQPRRRLQVRRLPAVLERAALDAVDEDRQLLERVVGDGAHVC